MEGLLYNVCSVWKTSDVFALFLKFLHTLAFPPYILLVLWSNIIYFLHAVYCFSHLCSPECRAAVCKSTYADETTIICCFQSPNFIFGAFRYLSDKSFQIFIWYVPLFPEEERAHSLPTTNMHIYLSAGSTASHSVLALLENSSPPQKDMGYIYYSHIPLSNE